MSEWLSLPDTITTSKSTRSSSNKKKFFSINITLIIENKGHKYSKLFQDILYWIDIITEINKNIILLEYEHIELPKYFLKSNNLPLFLGYITSWFQKFDLNKASLIYFLYKCLFPLKVSTFGENLYTILYKLVLQSI